MVEVKKCSRAWCCTVVPTAGLEKRVAIIEEFVSLTSASQSMCAEVTLDLLKDRCFVCLHY